MPRLPVLSAAASAAALLLAVVAVVTTTSANMWGDDRAAQLLVDVAIGVAGPLAGTLILAGRDVARGARSLALVLVGSGLASAGAAATTGLALAATEPTALAGWWVQLQGVLWVPGFLPLLTLVPLLYPDGLLPGRPWRWAAYASGLGMALLALGVGLLDEPFTGRAELAKPLTVPGIEVLAVIGGPLLMVGAVCGLLSLVVRYRRSRGLRRRQVVVLLAAAAVVGLVTALQAALPSPLDVLVQAVVVLLPPLAIGVAVTRHRLYDLDLAVCRALAGASLSVCLVGAYLSTFAVLQALTDRSVVSAGIAAALAGVVLQPLGRRLTTAVDRLYFGHRSDPYVVTSGLAARLTAPGVDVADVPGLVCDVVVEGLRLRGAELRPTTGAGATRGRLDASMTTEVPLRHRGSTVATLAVTPREGEDRLDPRDAAVLAALADQAAPAVAALDLHAALQRSREELVAARESERLRIRHELHDGLGATLAGLRLQVESAQDLVGDRPEAARILAAAGSGVATAVAEVRTLCEDLRPPGIDDLGLARALLSLGHRMSTPDLTVTVDVADGLVLDPAVEVAVYRIAAEALANAVRHSGAARASLELSLAEDPGTVDLVVSDDGRGLPADPAPRPGSGLGLPSIRQRAEEVGGRARVGPRADGPGTEVHVSLPTHVGGDR